MLNKIWSFTRHNSGILISTLFLPVVLLWAYGCQSSVVSLVNSEIMITREELALEVDHFLASAELKFKDLDRQDLVKNTIFNSLSEVAKGNPPNLPGVLLLLGNIMGLGAVVDNVRKRTHINTLKGTQYYGKVK